MPAEGTFQLTESVVTMLSELAARLRRELGEHAVITDRARLRTYECDGLTHHAAIPGVVVLARSAGDIRAAVRACHEARVPFVARGSGSGLSGGATPVAEGVLIVMATMRAILDVDAENQRATVEPGAINLAVSEAAAPYGLYFAPDPSSQQICSIGGNVAENSGGAHCLKYGFTTTHVLSADVVLPDGSDVTLGTPAVDAPGYDLLGAFVGSEGTLGITTRVVVRLLRRPESVRTVLAAFPSTDHAGEAVSAVIGAGVVPAAIEMMDALAIEAAEVTVQCDYPKGAGAVLIVESDGPAADVDHEIEQARILCEQAGAFEIREAADDAERALIWKGRKSAFAAVGRISPAYYVQDGVIPRTALPQVLRRIRELSEASQVRVANVFHAGDGNLHPLVLYDDRIDGQEEQAEQVSAQILALCLEHGGSITGEHGVGVDKREHMPEMFSEQDLDTMQRVRCAFDPRGLSNPGKVFPTPRLCGEAPGPRRGVHPLQEAGVEIF